jgi:hypothetical protein
MVAIAIDTFGGMIPKLGKQALPEPYAQKAENCDLLGGELRALHRRGVIYDARQEAPNVLRAYRAQKSNQSTQWVFFDDDTVDFLKGPLINDAHDRHYWTSENDIPRYNTLLRMDSGDLDLALGVPPPETSLTVEPPIVALLQTTRAYTYTFVTSLGEEGPPVAPTVATGDEVGTWELSGMDAAPKAPWDTESLIDKKNIYRTIAGALGTVDYHLVATVALNVLVYSDNFTTEEVALNRTIQSEFWYPPPKDLIGIVAHPNGFLIGFGGGSADVGNEEDVTARDIYFSEPYRPHAWNPQNVLSTEHVIKGFGIFGTSAVVPTTGHPYILSGIRPESMVMIKAETPEPCLSDRRGIVSMPYGVLYPTDTGLILASPSGFDNITKDLVSKEKWLADYTPTNFRAAREQNQYVAFYTKTSGIMLSPHEPLATFIEITGYWDNTSLQTDPSSGDLYLVDDGVIYNWSPPHGIPITQDWWSREYDLPKPVNFGAARIIFGRVGSGISPEELEDVIDWNDKRYAAGPLAPINSFVLGGVEKLDPEDGSWPPHPETKNTHQSGPLVKIGRRQLETQPPANQWEIGYAPDDPDPDDPDVLLETAVQFMVYANGRLIISRTVTDNKPFTLPSGFKAARWSFRVRTTADIQSIKIAETGAGLLEV